MLSDIEITYFRSRIEDVLQEGRTTKWQRQFLADTRDKIARYGTRTRLSENQMATLRRLTKLRSDADLRFITDDRAVRSRPRGSTYRRAWTTYRKIKSVLLLVVLSVVVIGGAITEMSKKLGFNSQGPSVASSVYDPADSSISPVSSGFGTQAFSITDGDTIKMDNGTRVRLVGFNAPEIFSPRCNQELALGNRATDRLRELVAFGQTEVTQIACSCKPGTEGTDHCNYGRSCGILRVDGRDVGQTLISEGLAVGFVCGATGCPPTPRPWCG
ncbi:thermonuclease family protein [Rhizobium sp. RAF56]|uniref:thermonuclease family protein n=1 Tax=Rhizobium sp. RAF56 TaxID=3233062 RepID=UPI003F951791